jgi:hypothetical protein
MTIGLKYHTKEADQHKKKMREKPSTPKKVNTGSIKLTLPIATQLYWKSEVKINSREQVLRTRQNILQYTAYSRI